MVVRAEFKIILNTAWKKNCTNAPSELPYCNLSFKKLNYLSARTYKKMKSKTNANLCENMQILCSETWH